MSNIAQGYLTASKHPTQFVKGTYPDRALGRKSKKLYTNKGSFTDMFCACGANLIGHNNSYSLPTGEEEELGGRIIDLFPFAEKVKILKTGSDSCHAAVRIARASTSKSLILGTGYHGWTNTFISAEKPGSGTVAEMYLKCHNLEQIINYLTHDEGNIAGVIIEPIQLLLDVIPKLHKIRKLCTEKGVVLIFDEIITGFRFPDYSVSNHYSIEPDLICLGKALGNGYPISILAGKKDLMETAGYFVSGTYFGEVASIREALKTLDFLTPKKLEDLWARGEWFMNEFNLINNKVQLFGYATRAEWRGDWEVIALFWQEMIKKSVFFGKAWFINFAHTERVLQNVLSAANRVNSNINWGKVKLEGNVPQPIFKRND